VPAVYVERSLERQGFLFLVLHDVIRIGGIAPRVYMVVVKPLWGRVEIGALLRERRPQIFLVVGSKSTDLDRFHPQLPLPNKCMPC